VIVDTVGSDFDTSLGVYTGETVSSLRRIAGNDDIVSRITTTSRVQFFAHANTSYKIAVDGFLSQGQADAPAGHVVLNIVPTPAPLIQVDPATGALSLGVGSASDLKISVQGSADLVSWVTVLSARDASQIHFRVDPKTAPEPYRFYRLLVSVTR
jgi:hypothetical protein